MRSHLVIGDTQMKPGAPTEHLHALVNFIKVHKPDVIVHIGDHWDMPSLSSYDDGTKSMEGRRIQNDIESGNEAIAIIDDGIRRIAGYDPEKIFHLGNHEARIGRFIENNPKFEGWVGYEDLDLDEWNVKDFEEINEIDGIRYAHYFTNPFSGRAYGGSVINKLNKLKFTGRRMIPFADAPALVAPTRTELKRCAYPSRPKP